MPRTPSIACPVCHKGHEGTRRNLLRLGFKKNNQKLRFECVACGCNVEAFIDWLPDPEK